MPLRLALCSLVLCSFVLCSAGPSFAETTAIDEIRIKGQEEFKLKRDGAEWKLHGPAGQKRTLRPEGNEWVLQGDDHNILLRTRRQGEGVLRVVDSKGTVVHELRRTSEGWGLHAGDGTLVWRVKLKPDKFNVYDGTGTRKFHGKKKEDGISIHDDKDAQIWKIKGLPALEDAMVFGVPIEMGEAALIFAAAHGR